MPMTTFTELEQIIIKICMRPQKAQKSQSNPELKKQSWKSQYIPFKLHTILQIYSYQNSVELAQKQTCRSMGENREHRSKPHTYGPIDYDKRRQGYTVEKRQFLQ